MIAIAYFVALRPASVATSNVGADRCVNDAATLAGGASNASAPIAQVERADRTGARGELIGYELSIRLVNGRSHVVSLPAESFVAEQVGSLVLYGFDAPTTGSEIHAVDVISGCAQLLVRPPDVVRSAVVDRQGENVYVHSVARSSRTDGGVTRFDLASGVTEQVVRPFRRDPTLGSGWETALIWNTSGTALAVEPCTMLACQTRVLDLGTGAVREIEGFRGPTIAFTDNHLYTFAAGDDWPTQVLRVGFDGATQLVATDVTDAALSGGDGRNQLVIQTTGGTQTVTP
jgi:hypothetical protein